MEKKFILIMSVIGVLLASGGSIANAVFIEDFSSTEYMNTSATTANWDMDLGVLRLYEFEPYQVGQCTTQELAIGIEVVGKYAYVADRIAGLKIIDCTDITSPTVIGSVDTPSMAWRVAVQGGYAYIADLGGGLQVVDISDPSSPIIVGSLTLSSDARDVVVRGSKAYIATYAYGLQIVDISDPANPELIEVCDTPGLAMAVDVCGNYAYIADSSWGFRIIDISNPGLSAIVGAYDTDGSAQDVIVEGRFAYVADASSLLMFDVTAPANPILMDSTLGSAWQVSVSGDHIAVVDGHEELAVYSRTASGSLDMLYSFDVVGDVTDVVYDGDLIYVTCRDDGCVIVRAREYQPPMPVGESGIIQSGVRLSVADNYAYVAAYDDGLAIYDISDAATPVYVTTISTPGYATGEVLAFGSHVAMAVNSHGLEIHSVADPSNPELIGSFNTPTSSSGFAIAGDIAFVVDRDYGLFVVDISSYDNPVQLGSCNVAGDARDVEVSGDYAYVTGGYSGVSVVNVSDRSNPVFVYSVNTPGLASMIDVEGRYAYVTDGYEGIQILDIGTPEAPIIIKGLNIGYVSSLDACGRRLYASAADNRFVVIDISDPGNAYVEYQTQIEFSLKGVCSYGQYVFATGFMEPIRSIRVMQEQYNIRDDVGESLAVTSTEETITRVSMSTEVSGDISWSVSVNNGGSWQEYDQDATWERMVVLGGQLAWRAELGMSNVAPQVDAIQLEYLYEAPAILSINDIEDDQGGWVRMQVQRSGYDFEEETEYPIVGYNVYRRVDDIMGAKSDIYSDRGKPHTAEIWKLAHAEYTNDNGRTYVTSKQSSTDSFSFPDGLWEVVASEYAVQQDTMILAVPTIADSSAGGNNIYTYIVTAHSSTPDVWYISSPDSGYSVDNLAPSVPTSLLLADDVLSWDESSETDFDYFTIYGASSPDLSDPTVLGHTTGTSLDVGGTGYSYLLVTATDFSGNEGEPAVSSSYCATSIGEAQHYGPGCDPNPGPCINEQVSLNGVVYVVKDYSIGGHYMQGATGGINFYDPDAIPLTPGDRIRITGSLWYDGNGEVYVGWPSITVLGNESIPTPQIMDTGALQDCGLVGSYVEARGTVTATGTNEQGFEYYTLDDGSGPVMVYIDSDTGASMASVEIGEQRWVRSPAMLFSGEIRLSPISPEHHSDNVATGVGDGDTPLAFRFHGAMPNPFNPMTTIRFELAHSTVVDLDVYDLSGRLIRRLVAHERMDGGVQDRVWDGTNTNGVVVSSGVYICRMRAGGYQESIRVMLLK
jgi:hypothetical protein